MKSLLKYAGVVAGLGMIAGMAMAMIAYRLLCLWAYYAWRSDDAWRAMNHQPLTNAPAIESTYGLVAMLGAIACTAVAYRLLCVRRNTRWLLNFI